ncbi:uncharacterized protein LOC131844301 [Achroia grisella]|uniref:uncharacterized protein LOC131844301 n=1 Tax=Achroia grisella TaxID=688607 RepID=UPI0027D1F93E|nr:uncharacterized protein LOC131844301 [Achroia grisella]
METHVSLVPNSKTLPSLFEAEKKFIYVYKSLPILWDAKHPEYSNKYQRHEALQKLLKVYKFIKASATVNDVRMKINTLRSNYRRELKKVLLSKMINSDSPNNVYKPRTWSFELLSFLGNQMEVSTTTDEHNASDCTVFEEIEVELDPAISTSPIREIECVQVEHTPAKKKSLKYEITEIKRPTCSKRSSPYHTCSCCTQLTKIRNSIARIWVDKLENLEADQRLLAEKAINDVLFEAEMGTLHRHSVKINQQAEECSSPYSQYFVSTQDNISEQPDLQPKITKEESYLSGDIGEHVVVLSQD